MKVSIRAHALFSMALLAAGVAHAQNSPSPSASLEIIRGHLARQGQIAYAGTTHDSSTGQTWSTNFTVEASNVTVDASGCELRYHWHTWINGKSSQELESGIEFGTAAEVTLISMAEDVNQGTLKAGHPTWGTSIQPPLWVVHVARNDGSRITMDFRDQATAQLVANAAKQAMRLCH